ncbi:hypothetical protein BpHYR1_037805 [Brachionus plicatilis]|uniref:Uncharacterized protein n=1 Tax=Brachionus plicatilis TaxID=10195 RepID=A0A3M7PTG9_BRAPC|nr:hypothetical protein BpHYR1_037805 [Brachionus plicatilis]
MGLSVSEREAFRKAVKNMISQMTKSDLEAYFTTQGISRSTIYNAINRIQIGDPLLNFFNLVEKKLIKVFFRFLCVKFINSFIYIHECLNERLFPFIHEYHQDLDYIFWPDSASSHYSILRTA